MRTGRISANGQRGNCDRAHHFNISISSLFGGLILWYRGSVEKRYAAERDFNHLKRNYEQLTANLTTLRQQEDDRFDGIRLRLNNIEQDVQRMHPKNHTPSGRTASLLARVSALDSSSHWHITKLHCRQRNRAKKKGQTLSLFNHSPHAKSELIFVDATLRCVWIVIAIDL